MSKVNYDIKSIIRRARLGDADALNEIPPDFLALIRGGDSIADRWLLTGMIMVGRDVQRRSREIDETEKSASALGLLGEVDGLISVAREDLRVAWVRMAHRSAAECMIIMQP